MTWIVLFAILAFAHTIETVLGFGATIIALSLGSQLLPLNLLLGALIMLGLVQSSWMMIHERGSIRWKILLQTVLPLCALGLIGGMALRSTLNEHSVKALVGLVISVLSAVQLVRIWANRQDNLELSKTQGVILLLAGGFFHGLFAVGGPFVIYYATRRLKVAANIRATLAVLWLSLNIPMLIQFFSMKQLSSQTLQAFGMLVPALCCGIFLGSLLKLNEKAYNVLSYSILGMCGALLLGA